MRNTRWLALVVVLLVAMVIPSIALADPAGTRKSPALIGEAVTFDNTAEKYVYQPHKSNITLLEVIRGDVAQNMVTGWNRFNDVAPEGKEYILLKFSISLVSTPDDSAIRYSRYDFSAFSKEGVEYDKYVSVAGVEPELSKTYPGGTTTGLVHFLINKGDDPLIAFEERGDNAKWFSLKSITVKQPTGTTDITGKVYVFSNSLKMRAEPNTNGHVLNVLKYGDALTVVDSTSSNTWWAVKTADGKLGYVARSYLGRSVFDIGVNSSIKVLSTKINIREDGNGTAKVLSVLPKGTTLTVLDNTSSKTWVKVKTVDGIVGWVGSVYVGGTI